VATPSVAYMKLSCRYSRVGYIKAHYRAFPVNFAKFGNSRLVSLDEVMFDDGSASRGDNVSRGLWD
jgi:hypothetical protein